MSTKYFIITVLAALGFDAESLYVTGGYDTKTYELGELTVTIEPAIDGDYQWQFEKVTVSAHGKQIAVDWL